MEKKYIEKILGNNCKIVTKEPSSKYASIITGIIKEIDQKDGLVIVKSKNGMGCLNLKYIVAIKPKNSLKENKKAMVGIGTLIVFIAMILVAAVAASILIRTSENLEQRAQAVATQTTKEVSAGLSVEDITGYTNENKTRITHLLLIVRPRAGSLDIDLSSVIITIQHNSLTLLTFDSSLVAHSNTNNRTVLDTQVSGGGNQTILDAADNNNFGVIIIRDRDSSIMNTSGINIGDRMYIVINLESIITESNGLLKRDRISGEIQPEIGSPGIFDIYSPAAFSKRVIDIW